MCTLFAFNLLGGHLFEIHWVCRRRGGDSLLTSNRKMNWKKLSISKRNVKQKVL
jgi:hypothetical protein